MDLPDIKARRPWLLKFTLLTSSNHPSFCHLSPWLDQATYDKRWNPGVSPFFLHTHTFNGCTLMKTTETTKVRTEACCFWHHALASLEKLQYSFSFEMHAFTPCKLSSFFASLSFGLLRLHASQVMETLWPTRTIKMSNKVVVCFKTKPLSGPAVKIRLEPVQAWRTRRRNQSFAGVAHRENLS